MAEIAKRIEAEKATRDMLADNDLPQPNEVEYGHTCIRLLWHEPKVCLVVDLDDPSDAAPQVVDLDDPPDDVPQTTP